MSKNASLNLTQIKNYAKAIGKFHYLIFILIMIGAVSYTVYKINVILNIPTDQTYKTQKEATLLNDSFDQGTIDKLQRLNYSNNPKPVTLPPGRSNPFYE